MFVRRKVTDARCWAMLLTCRLLLVVLGLTPRDVSAGTPILRDDSSSAAKIRAQEIKFYASAHPYMDEGLIELKKAVPELKQLRADDNQSRLSDILGRTATELDEPLSKAPNVVAREVVTEAQPLLNIMHDPCPGMGACMSNDSKEFNYIVLIRRGNANRTLLKEYRTTPDGKAVPSSDAPHSQGFASAWLIFSAANQPESHFRFLGEQKMDGFLTYVVAFAQVPGSIENPGYLFRGQQSVPMVLQGVAWIRQKDYRITHIRTDLLAPQNEIGYQGETAEIEFRKAQISALHLQLWLPSDVTIATVIDGQLRREHHHYSKYQLYETKSKIVLDH